MLFNTTTFLLFFAVVYSLYLGGSRYKVLQNVLLLAASYVFYGYWNWRFLLLIAVSTLVDYSIGLLLGRTPGDTPQGQFRRKLLLFTSVAVNLSILGFFKYFNFFADSLADILSMIGLQPHPFTIAVILPVGISFYTFQTMSYTIDVYRGRLQPARSLLDFALFVAFFPQLVAGPIERAVNLLPQIQTPRKIDLAQIYAGLYLVLWGYFKKMVIADNMARIADPIFNNYTQYTGADLLLGVLAFAFQIYGDFSGYTDIARGVARLLGFELMLNFRLPYFALSPADFWRRWHVSLSSWLRDYLYIPLGGNRGGSLQTYRNLMITMLLGGLWHGAAWNFVVWGAYHGLILVLYRIFAERAEESPAGQPAWRLLLFAPVTLGRMGLMFALTLLGWLIFRSSSLDQIGYMLSNLSVLATPGSLELATQVAFYAAPLLVVQVFQHYTRDLLVVTRLPALLRITFYLFLLLSIMIFGVRESTEFIYFQF